MLEKLKKLTLLLNSYGVPLPFVRDPVAQAPSVSLTLLIVSAAMVFLGLVGKASKLLDVDLEQSLYWFGICSALYFGRKMVSTGNKSIELEEDKK